MRVLIVTNMYPTPARPASGGFVRDQVEALAGVDGVDLDVFAFAPRGATSYARAAARLRRLYARERFDVVHAHYGLSGWVSLALRRAPHVVTFHGTDLEHPVVGPLSRLLAQRVTVPAPVSGTLARAALGARRTRAVLPCGVNLERFRPLDRRAARERLGLDPDGRYLLFPSDPARREKRHDRAAAVAAALGAKLLAYGAAAPEQVPLLINAANAVLAPSEREGFGLAPLEALACDVPVVATDVGVARVALAGVPGTLCAPYHEARWRRALAPHLDDRDPRVAGRARAALFARDRLARRVLAAYRDVTAQGASSAAWPPL